MTKKTTTKTATEQVKRPTIKSLQQEVANLTEQLMYANKLAVNLEIDLEARRNIIATLNEEILELYETISNREGKINDLENRSILAQIMFKLSKSFR
jgi:predicted  nucleic acid-binding Zn-ribbon protein